MFSKESTIYFVTCINPKAGFVLFRLACLACAYNRASVYK